MLDVFYSGFFGIYFGFYYYERLGYFVYRYFCYYGIYIAGSFLGGESESAARTRFIWTRAWGGWTDSIVAHWFTARADPFAFFIEDISCLLSCGGGQ